MGDHDKYGKTLMLRAFGAEFDSRPPRQHLSHEGRSAGSLNIDGVIYGEIAVEIESRVNKQVRGAIMDLILHPAAAKLLILINEHGNDFMENQANHILSRYCAPGSWRVLSILGSGNRPSEFLDTDIRAVRKCVSDLREVQPKPTND